MRPPSAEFRRRQAIVRSGLRAVPCRDLSLDTYQALLDANYFVRLRPVEFSAFALAVASVQYRDSWCQRVRY